MGKKRRYRTPTVDKFAKDAVRNVHDFGYGVGARKFIKRVRT